MKGSTFAELIFIARKKRGISQAEACEVIGVSDPSTLSKWENGVVAPSEEMIIKIMAAYDEPIIGYVYLRECTKIGKLLLPEVLLSDLDNLALNFQNEFEDVKEVRREILEIARDSVVDEYEMPRWIQIRQEVEELIGVLLPLMIRNFAKNKTPSQGGNLVRAHA